MSKDFESLEYWWHCSVDFGHSRIGSVCIKATDLDSATKEYHRLYPAPKFSEITNKGKVENRKKTIPTVPNCCLEEVEVEVEVEGESKSE